MTALASDAQVTVIALEGDTAPDTDGAIFVGGSFDEPMVNNTGDVAFIAGFTGFSTAGTGVFYKPDGQPMILVAKTAARPLYFRVRQRIRT